MSYSNSNYDNSYNNDYNKSFEDNSGLSEENQEDQNNSHGLNLAWTLGLNYKLIDSVHNLTSEELNRESILYTNGNNVIINEYKKGNQRLLQGHCNLITACIFCKEKDICITADKGPNSLLIVWCLKKYIPIRTIFEPHKEGIESLDISDNGDTILSLSIGTENSPQEITAWDWNNMSIEYPKINFCVLNNESNVYYNFIKFNQSDLNEFAITGKKGLKFCKREEDGRISSYSPTDKKVKEIKNDKNKNDKKKKKTNKKANNKEYTQTVFIPKANQSVTGAEEGQMIVWDISFIMEDYLNADQRREIKVISLLSSTDKKKSKIGISIVKVEDNLLIIGSSNGSIRFYDFSFRIICWFEDINLKRITSISFSLDRKRISYPNEEEINNDNDNNKNKENEKILEDIYLNYDSFIVVDNNAKIIKIETKKFQSIEEKDNKGELIMNSFTKPIRAIACKPNSSILAICCDNQKVYEWNYLSKSNNLQVIVVLNDEIPTCIAYSPDGEYLAIGTNNSKIYIKNKNDQFDLSKFLSLSPKKDSIICNKIVFSENSKYISVMDSNFCVTLFKWFLKDNNMEENWDFNGKIKSHLNEITDICFGESTNSNNEKKSRLFSIGKDKLLIEYNIEKSNKNSVHVDSVDKIEYEDYPTSCIWYPYNYLKEPVIMVANSSYKLKLYTIFDSNNRFCKKTVLGPTYEGTIKQMIYLNITEKNEENSPKYIAYSTENKIIGILKLPLDGNPNKTIGMIAHCDQISSITSSSDGKYIFSCGGKDLTLNMWKINLNKVEDNINSTNKTDDPMEIYWNLLEGGKKGQLNSDLNDFFYYSQIRSKTENTTKARKLDGKIPVEELPNMMNALGYYPTKREIKNMIDEIRYSKIDKCNDLEINTFVKLFINHRPVYGLTKEYIGETLGFLTKEDKEGKYWDKEEVVSLLYSNGENFEENELEYYLKILIGNQDLPNRIDLDNLINTILGFEEEENEIE